MRHRISYRPFPCAHSDGRYEMRELCDDDITDHDYRFVDVAQLQCEIQRYYHKTVIKAR